MVLLIAWAYKRYPSAEGERDLILYTAFIGLTLVILVFIFLSAAYHAE
jgi:ABC-type lipoprotein release transport system permease subunit